MVMGVSLSSINYFSNLFSHDGVMDIVSCVVTDIVSWFYKLFSLRNKDIHSVKCLSCDGVNEIAPQCCGY